MSDINIIIKNKQTKLKFKRLADMDKSILFPAFKRALLYLEGAVDKNLATGKYGIKTRSGRLRTSLDSRVRFRGKDIEGIVGTNLVYAAIQERGGRINVTSKMAAFAWHKWYETGLIMWKAIALMKGRQVVIPAHWYMRNTAKAERNRVSKIIKDGLISGIKDAK